MLLPGLVHGCDGGSPGQGAVDPGDTSGGDVDRGVPAIAFSSPAPNQTFAADLPITLRVECSHPQIAPTALEVAFSTSRAAEPLGTARPNAAGLASLEVAGLEPGQHTISATVTDGSGGRAIATIDLSVNSSPGSPFITLTPEFPKDDDDVSVVIVQPSIDAEGDEVRYSYRWLKNGEDAGLHNPTLPAAATARGEVWKVFVTPSDAIADGLPASAEVTIANTAPTCAAATLLPSGGSTSTVFNCACTDRDDPDPGDPVEDVCTFSDEDGPLGTPEGPCTLDPSLTTRGQRVTCAYIPGDSFTRGVAALSPSVDILNTSPMPPAVVLSPETADATTLLTCTQVTPGRDDDDDGLTYAIEWLIGDTIVPQAIASSIRAGQLTNDGVGARRGDTVRCRMWSDDGTARSSQPGTSPPLVLENARPTSGQVLVQTESGRPPTESETLTCVAIGSDADLDPLTPVVTWKVDDEWVSTVTTPTLTGLYFDRGDSVTCTLSFSDGLDASPAEAAKNSLVIKNSPPAITSVGLTPQLALRSDTFRCLPSGWSDADGDAPDYAFSWYEVLADGTRVPVEGAQSGSLDASRFEAGDTIICTATPRNGNELGSPVTSNPAAMKNTPPSLASAALTPASAYAGSTLSCSPQGFSDADGHSPVYRYSWTRNGTPVTGALQTLSGPFLKGDRYRCLVIPGDGFDEGATVLSNEVSILNSLPTISAARITPENGNTCADFRCEGVDARDPDPNDIVGYATTWFVNGTAISSGLASLQLAPGDTLSCRLSPTDGTVSNGVTLYGEPVASAPITVTNVPPSAIGVTLTPSDAGVGDLLRCAPSGYLDDCTRTPNWHFEWMLGDEVIPGATSPTLDTRDLRLNDEIRCRATPRDPFTSGLRVESAPLLLGPGDAVPPKVTVEAAEGADGPVKCTIIEPAVWFIDPTHTYYWRINDGEEFTGESSLDPDQVEIRHCDVVSCRIEVSDAFASLSSNRASTQMPVGTDCDDGNDCTSPLCDPAGGCGRGIMESGIPCASADPCELGECLGGVCQGLVDLCTEEPIAAGDGPSYVGPWSDGGYIVAWDDIVRLTSWQDSRLNESTRLDPQSTGYTTSAATLPDGRSIVLSEVGVLYDRDYNSATTRSRIDGRIINAAGDISPVSFRTPEIVHIAGTGSNTYTSTLSRVAFPVILEGTPAIITSVRRGSRTNSASWTYSNSDIFLVPSIGALAGQNVTVAPTGFGTSTNMHGTISPANDGNRVFVTWVTVADAGKVYWRISDFVDDTVSTLAGGYIQTAASTAVEKVRVIARPEGDFILLWTGRVGTQADVFGAFVSANSDGVFVPLPTFRVNTVIDGNQTLGGAGAFGDGGFVVSWNDSRVDGLNNAGIMAQRFTSDGLPESQPVSVNTFLTGSQANADLSVIADDDWVVTWHDANLGLMMTRRFFRDGTPVPGPREVVVPGATSADQKRPVAAAIKSAVKTTLVAWDSPIFLDEGREIAYRILGADGRPLGPELLANTLATGDQVNPVVAANASRFMLVWETPDAARGKVLHARYIDPQGSPIGAPFAVDPDGTAAQEAAAIVALPAPFEGFAVAWQDGPSTDTDIRVRRFLATGEPAGPAVRVNTVTANLQARPALTALSNGTIVIGWQSFDQFQAGSRWDLYRRTLTPSAAGDALAAANEQRINAVWEGDQVNLALLASPTGYMAACWESPGGDGPTDVKCQTFTTSNFAVRTPEFQVAERTLGAQASPSLALDATGSLIVAFESDGIDIAGRAILMRRMSIQGPASGLRVMPHRFSGGDQTHPWVAPLEDGRLWVGWESSNQDGSGTGVYARLLEAE
jgi:hypothetical protein